MGADLGPAESGGGTGSGGGGGGGGGGEVCGGVTDRGKMAGSGGDKNADEEPANGDDGRERKLDRRNESCRSMAAIRTCTTNSC